MKATASVASLRPAAAMRTPAQAIAFVAWRGIALEASRRGALASLVGAIQDERMKGDWTSHRNHRAIFAATRAARDCGDALARAAQGMPHEIAGMP